MQLDQDLNIYLSIAQHLSIEGLYALDSHFYHSRRQSYEINQLAWLYDERSGTTGRYAQNL